MKRASLPLLSLLLAASAASLFAGCGRRSAASLEAELQAIVDTVPARVGIAVIDLAHADTVVVGNDNVYALMSVFKLHEALAVAAILEARGQTFDTLITIGRADLNPDTWSPMVERFGVIDTALTVDALLADLLLFSDNNASNILFDKVVPVTATDSIVKALTGLRDFDLRYTERQMQADHALSYGNRSTPLACALLIAKVFTDSLVAPAHQQRIRELLAGCQSAPDRIAAAVTEMPGATLAHRTGSGYTNPDGAVTAVNDVAYITLPGGRHLALAVLVRDYHGPQARADAMIARVARAVIAHYSR